MSIKIFNTLSKSLEDFIPTQPGHVKMYACGITVYDEAHIGHASQAVFFDIIRTYFEYRGFKVDYVRNFTDIDDKIIRKANQQGKEASEISEFFINETRNDLRLLKVRSATIEPKVTDHIDDVIEFITGLVKKEYAYESSGDILFAVDKYNGYGKLSNRKKRIYWNRNLQVGNVIQQILPYGKPQNQVNHHGILPGAKGGLGGISNVL